MDFNHDDHLDIVATYPEHPFPSVFLNDGSGSFLPYQEWVATTDASGNCSSCLKIDIITIVAADLDINQDGLAELVNGAINRWHVWDGASGYTERIAGSAAAFPGGLTTRFYPAVGDFTADGSPDVVLTHSLGNRVRVWKGPYFTGAMELVSSATLDDPTEVFPVDWNHDSHPDVLLGHNTDEDPQHPLGFVTLLFGVGTGEFFPALVQGLQLEHSLLVEGYNGSLANADFNQDGFVDLAVVGKETTTGPAVVRVFHGDGRGDMGGGDLPLVQTLSDTTHAVAVVLTDLNSDSSPDLVVADRSDPAGPVDRLLVYQGTPAGVFSTPTVFEGFHYTREHPAVGDFDGDGRPDIVTVDADQGVFVHLNRSGPPDFRRGDADSDGVPNGIADCLFTLQYEFVPGSPSPSCFDSADVDDDGLVRGLIDGLALLQRFFSPGAPPLPAPGLANCGPDPTPDALSCVAYPRCP